MPCLQVAAVPFLWSTFLSSAFQGQQAFYAEFSPKHTLPNSSNAAVMHQPGMQATPAPTWEAARVHAQVVQAVRAVHGQEIGGKVPLVQAGLDSLGEACPPACPACTAMCAGNDASHSARAAFVLSILHFPAIQRISAFSLISI